MNLNERAAKCMGWEQAENGLWWSDAGPEDDWCPSNDYTHARILYERVVKKGLKDKLIAHVAMTEPTGSASDTFFCGATAILDLTADQLTEAYCEVLEQVNGSMP